MVRLLQIMAVIDDKIAIVSKAIVSLLVLGLIGLVTYSVILRYVFDNAPPHTDQIATFLVVGIVFIGASATFVMKAQIRVLVFDRFMPERMRQFVRLFTLLLAAGIVGLLCYEAWTEMFFLKDIGMQVQMWRGVKLWWPFMSLPVGLCLLALVFLLEVIRQVFRLINPELIPSQPDGDLQMEKDID